MWTKRWHHIKQEKDDVRTIGVKVSQSVSPDWLTTCWEKSGPSGIDSLFWWAKKYETWLTYLGWWIMWVGSYVESWIGPLLLQKIQNNKIKYNRIYFSKHKFIFLHDKKVKKKLILENKYFYISLNFFKKTNTSLFLIFLIQRSPSSKVYFYINFEIKPTSISCTVYTGVFVKLKY